MFSNLSVKAKLGILVIIQIIILSIFVINSTLEKYKQKRELEELKISIELSSYISKTIHEIQKERGFTAGFIGSKGNSFKNELQNQRENSDKSIQKITQYISDNNIIQEVTILKEPLKIVENKLNEINEIRKRVNTFDINLADALKYYTSINNIFLESIISITKLSNSAIISQKLNAYANFLLAKERTGIERAIGANAIANKKFSHGLKNKFVSIIAEQNAYLKNFFDYSTLDAKDFYNTNVVGKEIEEIIKLRADLLDSEELIDINTDSSYWFKIVTKKINMFKKVDDYLADTILQSINNEISSANNMLIIFIVIAIIGWSVILILSYLVSKDIINKIEIFQKGLLEFFRFLNKEKSSTELLKIESNDEFGQMSKIVNSNIQKTKKLIDSDDKFIQEVTQMVNEVNKGYLFKRFENSVESENLEKLRINMNKMLENLNNIVGGSTNKVLDILESFAKLDFTNSIKDDNGKIPIALNNVTKLITQMLVENKANGLTLNNSANVLMENVETLSSSSNQAAASLEETAAALEEITTTIVNNTENVMTIANYSKELTKSAMDGQKLANQTNISMDDINQEVSAINEAITVIDQIAFQTNILSLNAAVEAATAGEAGKGFAVVAGEVRNLASRSAEAAKEIKNIVEKATAKANSGKMIAAKMIDGYNQLNLNISKTSDLIKDIEAASKEQQSGIEQINNAVTQLDQQTQQNANIASQTASIAKGTQKIAQIVIKNANEKEFLGKDEVKAIDIISD